MNTEKYTNQLLALLAAQPEGLSATEIRQSLKPRISQPTLSRRLLALRARGLIANSGDGPTTRYQYAGDRRRLAELRSRAMHSTVARNLVLDPSLKSKAYERLNKLRKVNPAGHRYHEKWSQMLSGNITRLLQVMTEDSDHANALRKESPFSTLISQAERKKIFRQFAIAGVRQ